MKTWFGSLVCAVSSFLATRTSIQLEIVALRHQLNLLRRRQQDRVQFNRAGRLLWVGLSKHWSD